MKWSDRDAERVFKWPVLILLSPLWAPLVAAIILDARIRDAAKALRARFGHKAEPHLWFAWHPVGFDFWTNDYGKTAWLEKVWRGRNAHGRTVYAATLKELERAQ